MPAPTILRGAEAIGRHLGITAKVASHLLKHKRLPVFHIQGCPCATPAALDDWRALNITGKLPG